MPNSADQLLGDLAQSGKLYLKANSKDRNIDQTPLPWIDSPQVRLRCAISETETEATLQLEAHDGDQVRPANDIEVLIGTGTLVLDRSLRRFATAFPLNIVRDLISHGSLDAAPESPGRA